MASTEAQEGMHSAASVYALEAMEHHLLHFVLLALLSGFASTAVILRFWARKVTGQPFALDDYLIALGLIFALGETFLIVYGCCYPVIQTVRNVPEVVGLQFMFLSPIFWVTAVTIIRAAIMSLYIRLFDTRSITIACYVVLAVNVVFGVSAVIADCVICWPITYRWAPSTVDGSCGDQQFLDTFIAVVNLVMDVVVVVLPMRMFWGLKHARNKRVELCCMFGIGLFICAITLYRVQVISTTRDPTDLHAQEAYCVIALLTCLEALLGVTSACLPFFKPLIRKARDSLSGRSDSIPMVKHPSQISSSIFGK